MLAKSIKEPQTEALSDLKRHNLRMQTIRLLYKKSPQSAAAIAKKFHVSAPTVRGILNELIGEQIVLKSGTGDSSGGRKPALFSLAGDAFYVLSVEVQHYKAQAVLVDSLNEIKSPIVEFETTIDDPDFITKLDTVYQQLLSESGIDPARVNAIGISMPGLIDPNKGINSTIKNPRHQAIAGLVSAHFKLKTYIENDARMQALGEFVFGKAHQTRHTLVVNWSWGLGLGIIVNGEIFQGSNGNSGEFSHIRLMEEGELCECGKRGCLQTIAGARKLLKMAINEIEAGTISRLTNTYKGKTETLTVDAIIQSALDGDELSISLINQLSRNLAWGLSILIQLYNPELILLNGPLTAPKQYLLVTIQQALHQYCMKNILSNVKIEISELASNAGLKGTAVMGFRNLFAV
ncbi:MAG: ROK family protein [Mangrovibacterium sp.]